MGILLDWALQFITAILARTSFQRTQENIPLILNDSDSLVNQTIATIKPCGAGECPHLTIVFPFPDSSIGRNEGQGMAK